MEPSKVALIAFASLTAGAVISRSQNRKYVPDKVWKAPQPESENGNRSTAGARREEKLKVGEHALQLYSLGTPNGVKVTILLEELADLNPEFEYDAYLINIMKGDQFGSDFVAINPNSKIPALVDRTDPKNPIRIFESVAIMIHLTEQHAAEQFLPAEKAARAEVMSWLAWQIGTAPYLGGGFGHFYNYAPTKQEYPINRYTMEVKRQLAVLDMVLAERKYIAGDEYTLADMAIWPWHGQLVLGRLYNSKEFLDVECYTNVVRWAKMLWERPAVKRGRMVNRGWGPPETQVVERHSRSDFEGKTWGEE